MRSTHHRILLAALLLPALLPTVAAQSFDRLDAHTPPDIANAIGGRGDGSLLGWLDENKWWLLAGATLLGVALILYRILSPDGQTKRLQRDALERLRKSLTESCNATRGPAKRVWITGSPRDPPCRLGRYTGHHRSVEAVWISYRTWLLGSTRLVATNPVDLNGLDTPEVHLRAIAINHTRGFGFAVPDTHNPTQRADWATSSDKTIATPAEFAEAWKAYYTRAIDNALAFYDALNAAEDRSFLRQEVTRSPNELTDTIPAPEPRPTPNPEANPDA